MRIGIITIKPYKKINNQYIGTQFFILGIPLFPINSYFIVDNLIEKGIEIGLHKGHLVKIYSTILVFIFSILLIIPEFININNSIKYLLILILIIGLLFIYFKYDNVTIKEKNIRKYIGNIVGINALPKDMNKNSTRLMKNKFIIKLQNKLNTKEIYPEIINKNLYTKNELPEIFIISLYEYRLNSSLENKSKVKKYYSLIFNDELPEIIL